MGNSFQIKWIFIVIFSLWSCAEKSNHTNLAPQQKTQTQNTEAQDKAAILKVMKDQEIAWSNNDLEGFMKGYIKSDSLKFYGKSGLTKGWQQTLDNYKKGYPTKQHSGTLTFTVNDISKIENDFGVHASNWHDGIGQVISKLKLENPVS